jgi:hypothetical protein
MISTTRAQRRQMAKENAKQPQELTLIPRSDWPESGRQNKALLRVWRSRDYLVQEYEEPRPAMVRLSVLRSTIDPSAGRWNDGITWDELQAIKNECGYSGHDALEVYPAKQDEVNVANIRHMWVMCEPVDFAWRKR